LKCRGCGSCCRVEGKVWLSIADVDRLAGHFNVSDINGLRKLGMVKNFCLAERENLECIFLEGNRCAIHHIKPDQCRASPPGGRLCLQARNKHGLP